MSTLRDRVAVFSCLGAYLRMEFREVAQQLITAGATVYSMRLDVVSAIQLSEGQAMYGGLDILRPGSYGIVKDLQTVPGRLVFRHKDLEAEEQELCA